MTAFSRRDISPRNFGGQYDSDCYIDKLSIYFFAFLVDWSESPHCAITPTLRSRMTSV